MSAKKRKHLDSLLDESVFGTKEAALPPTQSEVVSPAPAPAPTPTASLIPETLPTPLTPLTPFALLSAPTAPQPFASAPEPVPVQSKDTSLAHRLRATDKEATVRFTVDMSESLNRKLSMLATKTGRKKVDRLCGCCWRMG